MISRSEEVAKLLLLLMESQHGESVEVYNELKIINRADALCTELRALLSGLTFDISLIYCHHCLPLPSFFHPFNDR